MIVTRHHVGHSRKCAQLQGRSQAPADKLPQHLDANAHVEPACRRGPARRQLRLQRQVGRCTVSIGLAITIDLLVDDHAPPTDPPAASQWPRLALFAHGYLAAPQRKTTPAVAFEPQRQRAVLLVARGDAKAAGEQEPAGAKDSEESLRSRAARSLGWRKIKHATSLAIARVADAVSGLIASSRNFSGLSVIISAAPPALYALQRTYRL